SRDSISLVSVVNSTGSCAAIQRIALIFEVIETSSSLRYLHYGIHDPELCSTVLGSLSTAT
ncbi:hypothetical protein ACTXT7_016445, partial [Hymenolepis weldensis]